jgi:hypothetical protein
VADIASLRKRLKKDYERLSKEGGWREVGRRHGITGAMAHRIANSDYEPKEVHARFLLGLPALVPAPVCEKCGDVHLTKRCARRPLPTRWADYPIAQLRAAIDNREELA